MEKSKIDMFLAVHADKFAPEHLLMLQAQLEQFPDDKSMILNAQDFKSPSTMLLISIFIGWLGIDRFMIGDTALGILKLITFGVCGVWSIIDCFLISDATKQFNFSKLQRCLMMYGH
jgi:hypothetical protein